jgi:hypothetical protein
MEIILGLICLALLVYIAYQERGFQRERDAFARERSEMMTRIQHPEFIVAPTMEEVIPDEVILEEDEIDRVGTIMNGTGDGED